MEKCLLQQWDCYNCKNAFTWDQISGVKFVCCFREFVLTTIVDCITFFISLVVFYLCWDTLSCKKKIMSNKNLHLLLLNITIADSFIFTTLLILFVTMLICSYLVKQVPLVEPVELQLSFWKSETIVSVNYKVINLMSHFFKTIFSE